VKIRAALHQVTDFKRVFDKYQETQPQPTDNTAQDRTRARSWLILNVYLNDEPLRQTVMRAWAEAYVLGQVAADEWIKKTERANKADEIEVNWDNWKPGDKATALLLNPTKGFEAYLQSTGGASYFKKFNKETIVNLGTALSDSIALGLDAESAAVMIGQHVASPSRALTIAITEQNRAMSFGSIERYKEAGLQKMEWAVSDPCDICAKNDGQVIIIGQSFASGDQQPPAHPHCRCVLLPVIPGMEDGPEIPGATMVVPPSPVDFGPDAATFPVKTREQQQIEDALTVLRKPKTEFVPGAWVALERKEIREIVIDRYLFGREGKTRDEIANYVDARRINKADLSLIDKGTVYQNGPIQVQFYSTGANLPAQVKQEILETVEKLQITNPKAKAVISIGSESSSKRGWALLGKEKLWITPKTARFDKPNPSEVGFKMPVLSTVSQRQYTLAHEWGHLIDEGGGFLDNGVSFQSPQTLATIKRLKDEYPDAFKSTYSAENTKEFYAEMFTEYWNSGGLTDNPLVQAMAKEFKWKALDVPKPAPVKPVAFPKNAPKVKTVEAWNKEEIIEIAKIKDNVAQQTQIWNGADKQYITAYRQIGDPRLKAILEAQGFAKTPTVVNAVQFDVLAKQGGIKVYRGVTETKDLTAAQMIEQFKNGDMFVGTGVIGNGVYTGTDLAYVIKYAGDKPENVMEMILSPKAKLIDAKDAEEGARQLAGAFYDAAFGRKYSNPEFGKIVDGYIEKLGGVPGSPEVSTVYQNQLRELGWLYHDPGAYAATNGYDAIKYFDEDGGVFVILNRGAVVVKE
jgi:SPP1 gp7 family putative phage head morphogenesis protein